MNQLVIKLKSQGAAGSSFEAGQGIALAVFRQSTDQLDMDQALQLMRGVFSGSMACLQVTMGEALVVRMFNEMLKAPDSTNASAGRH